MQIAVAAAALSARDAALDGKRLLVSRIASVGEHTDAHVECSNRVIVFVEADCGPADGVGAEIEAQSVVQAVFGGRVHVGISQGMKSGSGWYIVFGDAKRLT